MFVNQVYLLILLVGILICNTSATEFSEQELKTHHIIAGITSKETLQSYIEKGELVRHEMNPYHINDTAICVPYISTVNINEISPPLIKLCGEKDIFDLDSEYDMNSITSKSIGKKDNMCVESKPGADIFIDSIILDCDAGVDLNGNQIFINGATINTASLDVCSLNARRIDIQNSDLYFGITQITVDQDVSFIRSTYIIASSIDINTNVAELQILLSSSLEASSDIQIRGASVIVQAAYIQCTVGSIFIETTDRLEITMNGNFIANDDLTINSFDITLNIDLMLQARTLYISGNMLSYYAKTTSIGANTDFILNGPVSINGDTFTSANFYSRFSDDSSDFTVFMSTSFEATDLLIEILGKNNQINFRNIQRLNVNTFNIVDLNTPIQNNIITIETINIVTFDDFYVAIYILNFRDISSSATVMNDFTVSAESRISMNLITSLQIGGNLDLSTADSVGAIDCIQINYLDVNGSVFISSYSSIHINTLFSFNVNFALNIQLFGDNELLEIRTIYDSFTANTIDISTTFDPSTSNEVQIFDIFGPMQVQNVAINTNSGYSIGGHVVNFVNIDSIVSSVWQINTNCDSCDIKMDSINSFQVDSFNVLATLAVVQLANINFYVASGFNSQSIRLDIDTVLINQGAIDIRVDAPGDSMFYFFNIENADNVIIQGSSELAEFTMTDCSIDCSRLTFIGGGDIIYSSFNTFFDDLTISTLIGSPTLNIYSTEMYGARDVYLQGELRLLDSIFYATSTMYLNGGNLEFCSDLQAYDIEFNHVTTTLDCAYGTYAITAYDSRVECSNLFTHKDITSVEQIRVLIIIAPYINSNGKITDPYSLFLYTNSIDSSTADFILTATTIEFYSYSGTAVINLKTMDPLNDKFYIAAYDITIIHDSISSEYPGTIEGNLEIARSPVAPPITFSCPDPTYGLNGNFNIFGVFDQFICDSASNVIISGYNDPTIEHFTNINSLEIKSDSSSEISPYVQLITQNSDDFSLYFGISELLFSNTWTLNIRINDNENYARLFVDIVNFLISPPEIIINILDDSAIFDATPIFHVFLCSFPQPNFGIIEFKDFISGDVIKDGEYITSASGKYYQAKFYDDIKGFGYHSLSFMFSPDLPPTPTPSGTGTPTPLPTPTPSGTGTPAITGTPTQTSTGTPTGTDSPTSTKSNSPTPTPTSTKSISPSPTPTMSKTQSPTTTKSNSATTTNSPTVSDVTLSASPVPSNTSTPTSSSTLTGTPTPSQTTTKSISLSPTSLFSASTTTTGTQTKTLSASPTPTNSPTLTATPSLTSTQTLTSTPSFTPTSTPTSTKSASNTKSSNQTETATISSTPTTSIQNIESIAPSIEPSDSPIPSGESFSSSPTFTPTTTKTVLVDIAPPLSLSRSPIPELITNTPSKSKMAQAETQNNNFQNPSPSPIVIPTAASFECLSCDVGSTKTVIAGSGGGNNNNNNGNNNGGGGGNIEVPFNSNNGDTVGGIYFPPETFNSDSENTIEINLVSNIQGQEVQNSNGDNVKLGNTIVDVVILDQFGNQVTKFSEPLTICLESSDSNEDECLGYYDTEKKEWICEDDCPEKEDGGLVCGKTDHLTSFALLLNGGGAGCEDEYQYLYSYLSIAFVGVGIIMVIIAIILIELYYMNLRRARHIELNRRLTTSARLH